MKIRDIQRDIEESLASLPTLTLPPPLEGLKHLSVGDRNPRVSIRYTDQGRKVREDADAGYFDPDRCELMLRFTPFQSETTGRAATGFTPVRIRGGSIADTVLGDRH